jgi:hypothetical protein
VKKTLEVSEEASSMPKAMQRKWERYWDIEVEAKEGEEPEEKDDEKKRKRRKRGDD